MRGHPRAHRGATEQPDRHQAAASRTSARRKRSSPRRRWDFTVGIGLPVAAAIFASGMSARTGVPALRDAARRAPPLRTGAPKRSPPASGVEPDRCPRRGPGSSRACSAAPAGKRGALLVSASSLPDRGRSAISPGARSPERTLVPRRSSGRPLRRPAPCPPSRRAVTPRRQHLAPGPSDQPFRSAAHTGVSIRLQALSAG